MCIEEVEVVGVYVPSPLLSIYSGGTNFVCQSHAAGSVMWKGKDGMGDVGWRPPLETSSPDLVDTNLFLYRQMIIREAVRRPIYNLFTGSCCC